MSDIEHNDGHSASNHKKSKKAAIRQVIVLTRVKLMTSKAIRQKGTEAIHQVKTQSISFITDLCCTESANHMDFYKKYT